MKTSHPQLALASSLLLIAVALPLSSCRAERVREILRLNIAHTPTHIAAGEKAHLIAYQEYREGAGGLMSVGAAPLKNIMRAPVAARWSVSDATLASVGEDGTLTALKAGRVTITGAWESYTAKTTVEVVNNLPVPVLPQTSAGDGAQCVPETVALSFDEDRTIRFRMSFDGCDDFTVEATAPEKNLPWKFETTVGTLSIRRARGPIASGTVQTRDGDISFTAWSEGKGAFPVSLAGRSVLLVGDSMAQGLAPFLKRKIEEAGGRFFSEPEQSSTIIWWQGSGRLRALIAKHRPDVVFIALGSNELFTLEPETRAPIIRRMVEEIGERPAYWIGPPTWKTGAKLVPVIEENFQAGRFYNSENLNVPRAKDGKHPTLHGYERWVELIWNWYARSI